MSQESRIKRGRTPDRQQKGSRGSVLGQTFCSDETVLCRPLCPKLRKKTETSEDDEYDDSDSEQQEDPVDCHVCATCLAQDEYDCMEDQIEQDAVTCFVAAGADIADLGTAEDILRCVHTELFEFYARGSHCKNEYTASCRNRTMWTRRTLDWRLSFFAAGKSKVRAHAHAEVQGNRSTDGAKKKFFRRGQELPMMRRTVMFAQRTALSEHTSFR